MSGIRVYVSQERRRHVGGIGNKVDNSRLFKDQIIRKQAEGIFRLFFCQAQKRGEKIGFLLQLSTNVRKLK